ncbi:LPS-assembly lipoprotein LptE [Variovorax ginsengisoli]|uniref:LPS-assembly lipoprotein LptE n=1 Tax=Variovorax ginsengisoli TaxID=363844 RepID=UPI003520497D
MTSRPGTLPRRSFLAAAAAAAVTLLGLAGCGFELRKAPVFAFKSLAVPGRSAMAAYVRRNMAAAGTVTIVPEAQAATAEAVLDILGETRDRVVVSTNSAGEVRELNVRLTIRFRLRTPAGKELLTSEIQQRRDVTYNETNALAKDAEIELLYRDMQTDIAQQILRRLAAVKEL